jgi:hypothetical protein
MSTEDINENSVFDRYYNPFDVKDGVDLKPDFKPDPHYLQLKYVCDEAVFRIYAKSPLVYNLSEIKTFIDEYEFIFDETEIWIILYSGFDCFSYLYLELCEHQVFIEEYGKYCEKAIKALNSKSVEKWIEEYQWLFNHINDKLDYHKECECNMDEIMKISNSSVHVYRKELKVHHQFLSIFLGNSLLNL